VLDYHTLSSTYLGDDEYGHAIFDTKRSEIGELLYRLKYRSDQSVINELVETAARFVRSWNPGVTILIPVPPSRVRADQPVHIIAERLGMSIGIPVDMNIIKRVIETPELKNVYNYDERIRLLNGSYKVDKSGIKGQKILLFDDLYRSGATMNAVTSALYDEGVAAEVYALALTRTRSRS
jgi:predicted amidophosphoribosyltransferase